jgi:hypothetical protein
MILTPASTKQLSRRLVASNRSGMKYLIAPLLLLTFTQAQDVPPAPAPSTTTSQTSQGIPVAQENVRKAKALLDEMIQALGGQAYLNIQDVSWEGRTYSFFHGRPNSVGTLFWRFYRYPDQERFEFTKQRDVAFVYVGDKGYEITYKGTAYIDQPTVTEYIRRRAHSLDWTIRKWLNEPGIALFYEGQTVAGEKPAEQVSILNAQNDSVTLAIDASSHLPIKKTYSWRDPKDKLRNTEDEIYDSYRPVQGIMTPYTITRYLNGEMSNQRFLHSVTYNSGLKDSLFSAAATYDPKKSPKR